MKKYLLVAVLAVFCTTLSAQGLKGTWFAGGDLDFGQKEFFDEGVKIKEKTYGFMPLVGKFISPDLAVGGAIGYHQVKYNSDNKTGAFTIQPLMRKYWNIKGNLYAFGQLALPVGIGTDKTAGFDSDLFSMHLQFAPGFDLIVNNWMTIEAYFPLITAGFTKISPDEGSSSTDWTLKGNSIAATEAGKIVIGFKFLF